MMSLVGRGIRSDCMSAWTCRSSTVRPPNRLLHLVLGIFFFSGLVPNSEEKHKPAGDIDAVVVASLKGLNPIRKADMARTGQN